MNINYFLSQGGGKEQEKKTPAKEQEKSEAAAHTKHSKLCTAFRCSNVFLLGINTCRIFPSMLICLF